MKNKKEIAELIALLSQAIDIIRNYNGEDADYLERIMEKTIEKINTQH